MQYVNIIKREGTEADQKYRRPNRAQPGGARNQQEDRSNDFRSYNRERDRPLPAFVVDVSRAEQLSDIAAEFLEDREFRAGSKKKEGRETEAAHRNNDSQKSWVAHINGNVAARPQHNAVRERLTGTTALRKL